MKNLLSGLFCVLFFLISCQKEKSLESAATARGSLQADATGDCLPKTVAGNYLAGKALMIVTI